MTSLRSFCAECRGHITKGHNENHHIHYVSSKWRAPRKSNIGAWKRIAAGEIWWDRNAITRKALKRMRHWNNRMYRGKDAVLEEKEQSRLAVLARIERAKQEKEMGPPDCGHEFCLWSYKKAISYYPDNEHYEGCSRP